MQLLQAALLCACGRNAHAHCRRHAHADCHKSREIRKPRRAPDHIEILKHIEFQYGGSKIQDLRLHGTPGRNLGFSDGHIETILNFNIADPRSMIQDSSPRAPCNLGSWIRHIETQYGPIFQHGPPRDHIEMLGRIGLQFGWFVR